MAGIGSNWNGLGECHANRGSDIDRGASDWGDCNPTRIPAARIMSSSSASPANAPAGRTNWVTPFIITRDSAGWIAPLLRIYRAAGLNPLVVVDDRSTDGTADVLARENFRFRMGHCTVDRAEPMVAEVLRAHPAGWLLRMDDDELPSRAMFDYLRGSEPGPETKVVGFARHFFRRDPDGHLSRGEWTQKSYLYKGLRNDWQYRLFRAEQVELTDAIHTPGFIVPEQKTQADPQAFIAHFVWILRTLEQRRAKVLSYDAQSDFAGSFLKPMYVPEDMEAGEVVFTKSPSVEFDEIARIMATAQAANS